MTVNLYVVKPGPDGWANVDMYDTNTPDVVYNVPGPFRSTVEQYNYLVETHPDAHVELLDESLNLLRRNY